MSGWANRFSDFGNISTSHGGHSSKKNTSFNNSFKHRSQNRYTPLNETAKASDVSSFKKLASPARMGPPKKQVFNFKPEKVSCVPMDDDWEEDFPDDADFDTIIGQIEQNDATIADNNQKNVGKITDEELMEMTQALMNDEWDFDSDMDMPPPPMDPAKARLNQTLAVLGGPTIEDFFDDGPKPEEIIQNLKEENKRLEEEVTSLKPQYNEVSEERLVLKNKLDAKSKELEKEVRLRRNLEANLRKELEAAHKQALDRDNQMKKLRLEMNSARMKSGSTSCLNSQVGNGSHTQDGSMAKKRKLSSSTSSLDRQAATEAPPSTQVKPVFDPLEGLDFPDFFIEQFKLLGSSLMDLEVKEPYHENTLSYEEKRVKTLEAYQNLEDIPELVIC